MGRHLRELFGEKPGAVDRARRSARTTRARSPSPASRSPIRSMRSACSGTRPPARRRWIPMRSSSPSSIARRPCGPRATTSPSRSRRPRSSRPMPSRRSSRWRYRARRPRSRRRRCRCARRPRRARRSSRHHRAQRDDLRGSRHRGRARAVDRAGVRQLAADRVGGGDSRALTETPGMDRRRGDRDRRDRDRGDRDARRLDSSTGRGARRGDTRRRGTGGRAAADPGRRRGRDRRRRAGGCSIATPPRKVIAPPPPPPPTPPSAPTPRRRRSASSARAVTRRLPLALLHAHRDADRRGARDLWHGGVQYEAAQRGAGTIIAIAVGAGRAAIERARVATTTSRSCPSRRRIRAKRIRSSARSDPRARRRAARGGSRARRCLGGRRGEGGDAVHHRAGADRGESGRPGLRDLRAEPPSRSADRHHAQPRGLPRAPGQARRRVRALRRRRRGGRAHRQGGARHVRPPGTSTASRRRSCA